MKRVLVISKSYSLRGPMAVACIRRFSKTHLYTEGFALSTLPLNKELSQMLEFGDLPSLDFKTEEQATLNKNVDYIITVCDEAKKLVDSLSLDTLHFHYHFSEITENGMSQKEKIEEQKELVFTMKQYFERFCKMYLNEYQ
jgi:DNA-binding transcriptional regulator WhiA